MFVDSSRGMTRGEDRLNLLPYVLTEGIVVVGHTHTVRSPWFCLGTHTKVELMEQYEIMQLLDPCKGVSLHQMEIGK
ncbi:unnamed protein product [Sphenostylis stenocarpa]|uniref:Uncharacterized protein n=1 Tax=Sphenostylis stenocarpa TaxID=92480 RepID=A0AA86TJM2_9FABA|nr:unnamed protein product [Sphenostylis stenocarpa]